MPVHATKKLGDILNAALTCGRVVLIASVNGSKAWQGFAEMTSPVSAQAQLLTFAGDGDAAGSDDGAASRMREGFPFEVRWLCRYSPGAVRILSSFRFQKMYINMISFSQTANMKNDLELGRPLNLSRNLQELDAKTAEALCSLLEETAKKEAEALQKYRIRNTVVDLNFYREVAQVEQHFFRSDTEEVSEATWSAFFAEVSRVGALFLQ